MLPEVVSGVLTSLTATAAMMNASELSTPANPLEWFLQYGVLGLVVIGFVSGWIVPGYVNKFTQAENQRLTALVEGKLFPMLEKTGTTLETTAAAMETATRAFERGLDLQQDRRNYEQGYPRPGRQK